MPLVVMASATDLIRSSLTLQPNLFQLFQPMGGVRAMASRSDCANAWAEQRAAASSAKSERKRLFGMPIIEPLPRIFRSDEERAPDSLASMQGVCEHSQHISPVSESKVRDTRLRL